MKRANLIMLGVILLAYFLLETLVPFGRLILYPIKLFVTYLHEFGHAFGSLITGGSVHELQVNSNGSGVTTTSGSFRPITIMGGYLGSAIFGNLLLHIGIRHPKVTPVVMKVIAVLMVITALVWFSSIFNAIFIMAFSAGLFIISRIDAIDQYVLMFLGGASVLHIISDFNVGPTSDLHAYVEFMGLTFHIWMYIWLGIVLGITFFNVRNIISKDA